MKLSEKRPFTGEHEILVEDITPGDIVCFVHEYDRDYSADYSVDYGVVLGVGENTIGYLRMGERALNGWVFSTHQEDRGLRPYVRDFPRPLWNGVNHTVSLGSRVSPTLLSKEQAEGIKKVFDRISEAQARHGVTPTEPSPETRALDAFVNLALEGHITREYVRDFGEDRHDKAA